MPSRVTERDAAIKSETTLSTAYQIRKEKQATFVRRIKRVPFALSVFAVLCFLYDIGFEHRAHEAGILHGIYLATILVGIISLTGRFFFRKSRPRKKAWPFEALFLLFLLTLIIAQAGISRSPFFGFFHSPLWMYPAILLVFVREFSSLRINARSTVVNPALLFVLSFLSIIILGGFLLLLPKATTGGISFIDALFTSTSAVCVTGLSVVNTAICFSESGKIIILLLIQVGGIGIMTFASYFSYFFTGVTSYEHQLILHEMTNAEKINEVFSILKKIILITFLIEGAGALAVFYTLDPAIMPAIYDRVFFSVFHAVSGFCNAGFSTLSGNLYQGIFQFNYPLHLIMAGLILLGGLGFPIVCNLLHSLNVSIQSRLLGLLRIKPRAHVPWLVNLNTRIVLITTAILTISGTICFFLFEYNNTQSVHPFFGKIVTSLFGAVTSRTAGFNTVDTSALRIPTVLVILFLMWVGASPGSTGGGIKTSTLAISVLNIFSIARGKQHLEIFKREISALSVNRAFAIITLSIIVIALSVMGLTLSDPGKGFLDICFECVSAFSTTGLSRGITPQLSHAGKFIIIITMFLGRIGSLTLMIALFKKASPGSYRYPAENILIN